MKKGTVVSLEAFRKKKTQAEVPVKSWPKGLPDARDLWELLDHNVSVHVYKKRAE